MKIKELFLYKKFTFWLISRIIEVNPFLYRFYIRRKKPNLAKLLANPETQLSIQGFPRSANTYCTVAFQMTQWSSLNIAHHLHVPSEVKATCRYGIPCIVLIRKPQDAIASLVVRDQLFTIEKAIIKWIIFYKSIMSLKEQFLIIPFDLVIDDFASVIKMVNLKYNMELQVITGINTGLKKEIFKEIETIDRVIMKEDSGDSTVSIPSEARNLKLEGIHKTLNQKKPKNMKKAIEIFDRYMLLYKIQCDKLY